MAAGFQMAAAIGLCAWGGVSLDRRLGTGPWFTLVGLILGLVVGLMVIVRTARQVQG
jgi:F0F1-type ATP synthase assembly protein I